MYIKYVLGIMFAIAGLNSLMAAETSNEVRVVAERWTPITLQTSLVPLTEELGLFKKHDVKLTLVNIKGIAAERAAMGSGAADVSIDAIATRGKLQDHVQITAILSYGTLYSVIAHNDIKSLSDLGGKVVTGYDCGNLFARPGAGPTQLQTLIASHEDPKIRALRFVCGMPPSSGADPETVYFVPGNVVERRAMLLNGTAHASTEFPNVYTLPEFASSHHILVTSAQMNGPGRAIPMTMIVARRAWLEENRPVLRRFVAALHEAVLTITNDRELGIEVLSKLFHDTSRDRLERYYDEIVNSVPEDLCLDPERVKDGLRFYAGKTKQQMPLDDPDFIRLECHE